MSLFSSEGTLEVAEWSGAWSCGDVLSKALVNQLNAANERLREVTKSSLEGRAREEQLKLQLSELQDELADTASDKKGDSVAVVCSSPDTIWRPVVKMLLMAWRSSRLKLESHQASLRRTSGIADDDQGRMSYFTNDEMEYIRRIANEALSHELCPDELLNTIGGVDHPGARNEARCHRISTPVLSPMRGDEEENESGLWYVSSVDDEPESSGCMMSDDVLNGLDESK